jgi:hypothetical protein
MTTCRGVRTAPLRHHPLTGAVDCRYQLNRPLVLVGFRHPTPRNSARSGRRGGAPPTSPIQGNDVPAPPARQGLHAVSLGEPAAP